MPIISKFYGIVIVMYYNDHNPPPHFYAKYSSYEAIFSFDGKVIEGELPKRAIKFVKEWISYHKPELEDNWQKAMNGKSLKAIAPLE